MRNVKTKDYLGKARLIAASDEQDAFTGFSGAENKKVSQRALEAAVDWMLSPFIAGKQVNE